MEMELQRKEMQEQLRTTEVFISLDPNGKGVPSTVRPEEQQTSVVTRETCALAHNLMEEICERANLNQAYKRVKSNKGSAGTDGMTTEELSTYIREHKEEVIQSLLEGTYQPQLVRGVKIPKPGGGKRQLGIPTVMDRLIQQAILQVIGPLFEANFSKSSHGFRPKRSAHQALKCAEEYVAEGYNIVVDIDLEKFFDRVNHDILMSRLARRIGDKRLLILIRRFLEAGIMQDGVRIERHEGTPQGGPLSPLLSNILLDELDKELERRGHRFARYADDCNIYVRSYRAGERVLANIREFLWKRLKLKVNEAKSAVAVVHERKFLGYSFRQDGKLKIAPEALKRMKKRVREITKRNRGINLETLIAELNSYLQGWQNYFKLSATKCLFRDLDSWIRRRLRCYRLTQRKRSGPIATFLISLGIKAADAWLFAKSYKGWWRLSQNALIHRALPNAWFKGKGLISLEKRFAVLNT
jgi:RNA-directed DNA polymerase